MNTQQTSMQAGQSASRPGGKPANGRNYSPDNDFLILELCLDKECRWIRDLIRETLTDCPSADSVYLREIELVLLESHRSHRRTLNTLLDLELNISRFARGLHIHDQLIRIFQQLTRDIEGLSQD
ncbi:MAG: hypothetical protein ACAI44_39915 [Candidatus Sericytochromatia bacterium]